MSATPDLLYSPIEDELRESVRSLLADRSPWTAVLARSEGDEPCDLALWTVLAAELGCAGLAVSEEHGGAGASLRETAVVAEELGRAVTPVPFLGSTVLTTVALDSVVTAGEQTGTRDEAAELLAALAAGARIGALVMPFSTPPAAAFPTAVQAIGGTLHGAVTSVADALPATDLVVPAVDADGPALYLADVAATERRPAVSLDLTRQLADLTFDGTPARRIASGAEASDAFEAAITAGAAILAAEQLGLADWCLSTTVEYLKSRHQFGRPVGSFQGLKHRLADLWVSVTQARAVARYAAACVATGDPDSAVAVAVAQSHCSTVAVRAAEECVQMHGGIGFTWEHPAHLYLKRAKSASIALGSPDQHRSRLAQLVDLPVS